jgi:hypothetical protein
MLKISNTNVYGFEESLIASGYPMFAEEIKNIEYDNDNRAITSQKEIDRSIRLGNVPPGSGHDNFLKGIIVQFDVKYPQYWTPQFQRYHFADIVSSQSKMHRITKMDIQNSCNQYVTPEMISLLEKLIKDYNNDNSYENFMRVISNTPMGFEMTMRVTSNYLQLKTIYLQRQHHKLKEDWGNFCDWIETLPHFEEMCSGGK